MKSKILILLILVPIVLATSCKKDEVVDPRDNFVATYNVVENWSEGTSHGVANYQISITKSASDGKIIISNFADFGFTIDATVAGNSMNVAQQNVTSGTFTYSCVGSGSLAGNVLTFSYTVNRPTGNNTIATCVATKR